LGQKRIKTIDLSEKEAASDQSPTPKGGQAIASKKKRKSTEKKPAERVERVGKVRKVAKEKVSKEDTSDKPVASKKRLPKTRSQRYQSLKKAIKSDKTYSPKKAIELVIKSANARFDESVDIDIVVKKEKFSGSVKLPHGTGKKKKIAIFDKKNEEKIKKGKIDFDLLIAKPADMKKVSKYGRVLGPKGLMPNAKAGTISDEPEKLVKKLQGGEIQYKTEKKAPLLHLTIGKISFGEKKLLENLQALLKSINPRLIKKAVLSSTMGPGVKLALD